jgi:hypothetical protein
MEDRVTDPVVVHRLRLKNVRAFRSLDLPLGRSALIIGKNGTNKTTLLRAIALALADHSSASAFLAQPIGRFIREGAEEAAIEVDGKVGPKENTWRRTVQRSGIGESLVFGPADQPLSVPPVFAYGAGRGIVGGDSSRSLSGDNFTLALSLFDYRRELDDPELTFRRLQDYVDSSRFQLLMASFRRLLELGEDDEIRVAHGGGIVLSGPSIGAEIPLAGWADGHRLTFTWLLDLFGKALQVGALDSNGDINGILLVDELDQHLHPALQAGVFDHLRKLLPRVQLIATTHSPLVPLGADPHDLIVLRRTAAGVVVDPSPRDFRGYTVEDMLADDKLFDAPIMAPAAQAQLDRYHELVSLGVQGRSPAQGHELRELAKTLVVEPVSPTIAKDVDATIAEIRRRLA